MKKIIMKSDVNNEQQPSEQPACPRTASVSVFLISLFLKHAAREKKKHASSQIFPESHVYHSSSRRLAMHSSFIHLALDWWSASFSEVVEEGKMKSEVKDSGYHPSTQFLISANFSDLIFKSFRFRYL